VHRSPTLSSGRGACGAEQGAGRDSSPFLQGPLVLIKFDTVALWLLDSFFTIGSRCRLLGLYRELVLDANVVSLGSTRRFWVLFS
jgi:hypothetical protein